MNVEKWVSGIWTRAQFEFENEIFVRRQLIRANVSNLTPLNFAISIK